MVRISLPNRLKGHPDNNHRAALSRDPSRASSPVRGIAEARSLDSLTLRVNVIKARDLAAKDRNGTSDPFLVVMLDDARSVTHAVNKSLNPEWGVCFDLPITGEQSLLLQCVCWDKDRFGKDYLGEFDVALDEVFSNGRVSQDPTWYPLASSRKRSKISGEVQLQLALIDPANAAASPDQVLSRFRALTATSGDDAEVEAEAEADDIDDDEDDDLDRPHPRVPAHDGEDADDVDDPSDETDDPSKPETVEKKRRRRLRVRLVRRKKKARAYEFLGESDVVGIVFLEIVKITDLPPERNVTRTSFDMDPFVVASLGKKTYRTRIIRHNLNPTFEERMIFQVLRHEQSYTLNFSVVDRDKLSGNDFVGTASIPLQDIIARAPDADPETGLYRLREPPSATQTGQSAQRSRFRLPISRSSSHTSLAKLSSRPPLRSQSSSSSLNKPSSPSATSLAPTSTTSSTSLAPASAATDGLTPGGPTLLSPAPSMPSNGEEVDPADADHDPELHPYVVPVALKNKDRWESKHSTELFVRAKYVPYPALRQQFWRAILRQYDADESGCISKVELATMLDTLGSTLKDSTIDSFFHRFVPADGAQDPNSFELTYDQAVIALEDQLLKDGRGKTWASSLASHLPSATGSQSASDGNAGNQSSSMTTPGSLTPEIAGSTLPPQVGPGAGTASFPLLSTEPLGLAADEGEVLVQDDLSDEKGEERVVEIHECPICHQPRMKKKSDADIITHIATCASHDWRQVNNLVMAGFVTPSQAQRKWYSKVITKISYGGYRLGANSANILVQDRITGQINEERMSVYVRLGIRLLYKGLKSREMEKKRIRKLLRSLSVKQGRKYDDPASAREIQSFINFHRLNMDEVLLPVQDFKNFNEFFYRALKPDARPCSAPNNPRIIVSPADCRSVVFNTLPDATSIWVKGREFSVARLLGSTYAEDAKRYVHGAMGIFRLAPQDYHRFHVPVDGVLDTPKVIKGEYYTVNPMAIRSALDVYGENVRVVVPIDSVAHGRVMVICVGAMMVGSTVITAKAGQQVHRAEELGYFKFGGSTILLLFEPGTMRFDQDLVDNSSGALETLIRVGMSIGHHPEQAAHTPDMQKAHVTKEEKQEAQRRIEGSVAPLPSETLVSGVTASIT